LLFVKQNIDISHETIRVLGAMGKHFMRFGLELHPKKTKLIRFTKPSGKNGKLNQPETFEYLGFNLYKGLSRWGT